MRGNGGFSRFVVVTVVALVLAGCSADGGDESKDTAPKNTTTTTVAGVDVAALDRALPDPGDLGPDWSQVQSPKPTGTRAALDDVIKEQCPDYADLREHAGDPAKKATRSYANSDGVVLDLAFSSDLAGLPDEEASLDAVDALDGCELSFRDETDTDFQIELSAEPYEDAGAYGLFYARESRARGDFDVTWTSYTWTVITDNGVVVTLDAHDDLDDPTDVQTIDPDLIADQIPLFVGLVEDL